MKIKHLILLFVILSCKRGNNELSKSSSKKINTNIIVDKIEIDSLVINTPLNSNPMELYWEKRNILKDEFLFDSNIPISEVYKFNLTKNKWEEKLKFNKNGPNGIGQGTGFFIKSSDSIFIFSGYQHKFFLFDKSLDRKKTYNIPLDFTVNLFAHRKCVFGDNLLFIPGTSYLINDKNLVKNSKLLLKVNLLNEETKKIINYPKEYFNKIWHYNYRQMSFVIKNDNIFVSFPISHKIYKYDLFGNYKNSFFAKSKYLNDFKSIINKNQNDQKSINDYYRSGYYSSILFDENNDLFYRLVYHLPKKHNQKDIKFSSMILSILLFNDKLEYIGEYIVDKKVSGYYNFITKDGLHLSIKGKYNNSKEESRKFYIYKF